jgi:molybdenum cofactor biosynthesis enzyme MoaA
VINSRLFDWYDIDINKNLKIKKRCPRPFDTVLIDKQGSCYLCECTSWLPQSAGNLQIKTLDEIINSDVADELQRTILDDSYRYCNNQQCAYLLDYKGTDPWKLVEPVRQIKHVRLAIDDSCNLSCPSCRTKKIFYKSGGEFNKRIKLIDKVLDFLKSQKHNIQVHIGSDGDPFASIVYRYFMLKTKLFQNLKYSVQTNGLLIKKNFHKFKHITDNLTQIGISIDGATKQTYEDLRQGGVWEKLLENLEFLKTIKTFKIHFHFVVQQKNYHEIESFIELGLKYNADKIFLNRITDWNTLSNFNTHAVADTTHPENKKLLEILNRIEDKENFVEFRSLL